MLPRDDRDASVLSKESSTAHETTEEADHISRRERLKKRVSIRKVEEEEELNMATENIPHKTSSTRRHSKKKSHPGSSSKSTSQHSRQRPTSKTPSTTVPLGLSRSRSRHVDIPNVRAYNLLRDSQMAYQRVPSCFNLPSIWNSIHDRFIAYLATHAKLTSDGKIPASEVTQPRWTTPEICRMLWMHFPSLRRLLAFGVSEADAFLGQPPQVPAVEQRLVYLDRCENDYFNIPYGGYQFEEWGKDI